ncbi:hypothetical protein N7474_000936 [Penicillium riverlandense]|uniref:uncharacterized protein n=1 Tax=Penicillium riverlandense TaxID=1903569 RepID=UPI0025480D15|nr:uncharacterized protein N7474_000936 [Penicillium riverlandense]KAJ5832625.1 hypothetical protein N7474_000936 [Penicillium riverlandense]
MAEESKEAQSPSEKYDTPTEGESLLSNPNSDAQGQLAAAVDELLDQLQSKFDNVSKEMFGKLDDMTRRLDELEASLTATSNDSASATPTK